MVVNYHLEHQCDEPTSENYVIRVLTRLNFPDRPPLTEMYHKGMADWIVTGNAPAATVFGT